VCEGVCVCVRERERERKREIERERVRVLEKGRESLRVCRTGITMPAASLASLSCLTSLCACE
jgi:hypothetical protein